MILVVSKLREIIEAQALVVTRNLSDLQRSLTSLHGVDGWFEDGVRILARLSNGLTTALLLSIIIQEGAISSTDITFICIDSCAMTTIDCTGQHDCSTTP